MGERCDVLILGAGSAGFGAALRAVEQGRYHVILADRNPGFGGTSVFAGVNCWEPGVTAGSTHRRLAAYLESRGEGFVGEGVLNVSPTQRCYLSDRAQDPYDSTLRRFGAKSFRRFHFDRKAMSSAMETFVRERDRKGLLEERFCTELEDLTVRDGQIVSVSLRGPEGRSVWEPRIVIDATGDIAAARMAGCEVMLGEDPRSRFGEQFAPEKAERILNGISQCFVIRKGGAPYETREDFSDTKAAAWMDVVRRTAEPVAWCVRDPGGDISVNMLPTIEGEALLSCSGEELRHECRGRVLAYFCWLRENSVLSGYEISEICPMIGIRESWRLRGRYVLTHTDILRGCPEATGQEDVIAVADHPTDTHGRTNVSGMRCAPTGKYGIPYECLLPREIGNLLVACRGSSFSHIAASSARLSRTMIGLGEAAGCAAVLALDAGIGPGELSPTRVCGALFADEDAADRENRRIEIRT